MFLENPVMAFCTGLLVALIGYHIYSTIQIKKEQERWFALGVKMEKAFQELKKDGTDIFRDLL